MQFICQFKSNIEKVESFTYFCSVISNDRDIKIEINCRISKATNAFRKLNKIWKVDKIILGTKLKLIIDIVVAVLLSTYKI